MWKSEAFSACTGRASWPVNALCLLAIGSTLPAPEPHKLPNCTPQPKLHPAKTCSPLHSSARGTAGTRSLRAWHGLSLGEQWWGFGLSGRGHSLGSTCSWLPRGSSCWQDVRASGVAHATHPSIRAALAQLLLGKACLRTVTDTAGTLTCHVVHIWREEGLVLVMHVQPRVGPPATGQGAQQLA